MTGLGGWRHTMAIRIGANVMYRRDYTLPGTALYKEHITIKQEEYRYVISEACSEGPSATVPLNGRVYFRKKCGHPHCTAADGGAGCTARCTGQVTAKGEKGRRGPS